MRKVKFLFLPALAFVLMGSQTDVQKSNLLYYKDSAGVNQPVKTRSDWAKKRALIIGQMEMVMGQLPDRTALPDLD